MPNEQLFIGLISGTSLDGIDAALVDFNDDQIKLLGTHHAPYSPSLLKGLRRLCHPGDNEIDLLGALDRQVGLAFADAVKALLTKTNVTADRITAIGSHGQTIRHRPAADPPFTLQIGDPNTLAEVTGITTLGDFRRRDMAAGGEGAPLVPAFHQAVFRSPRVARAVLNLGGIANITCLPAGETNEVIGYDTGPASTLLDTWIDRHRGEPFDRDGLWAASGQLNPSLLQRLLADTYFDLTPPKSTGPEHFNLQWLESRLPSDPLAPEDVQRTLTELTAVTVADAIRKQGFEQGEVIVCGGGSHNRFLLERLRQRLPMASVDPSDRLGMDPDWIEATAFAWLAKRTLAGQSGNLPAVTGAARPVILGAIYPGG
jgi:anhydro-N-acetylmuramic acid kinase